MENTEYIFNAFAKKYQEKFMDTSEYRESLEAFSALFPGKDLKVLDIGCGTANMSVGLLQIEPSVQIYGIDISANMLEIAARNIPSGEFRKMNALEIDKLNENFDGVICAFCLPYISEAEVLEFMKKVSEILNPNGAIYLSTMIADTYTCRLIGPSTGGDLRLSTHFHTRNFIKKNLLENGFSVVQEFFKEEQVRDGQKFRDHIFIAKNLVS